VVDQIVTLAGVVLSVFHDVLFSLLLQQLPQKERNISLWASQFQVSSSTKLR
jgi:hypothetical protein